MPHAWKRIIRVAVLDFEEEVRETHMKVMRGVWTEYDVGRVGNNASVKCTVCNVFLCDNKARFPNCEKTCWDIWHTVVDFEKVAKTLCHLKNPSNHCQSTDASSQTKALR